MIKMLSAIRNTFAGSIFNQHYYDMFPRRENAEKMARYFPHNVRHQSHCYGACGDGSIDVKRENIGEFYVII